MLKSVQKFLFLLLLALGVLYLLYQLLLYNLARESMPTGMIVGGIDVSGLTIEETAVTLTNHYLAPLEFHHQEERVLVNPQDAGFTLDVEATINQAETRKGEQEYWQGFFEYVIGRPLEPVEIRLVAYLDREQLKQQIESIAAYLDRPATAPQLTFGGGSYQPGQPGYVTDIEASLPAAEVALFKPQPEDRRVDLVLTFQDAIDFNLSILEDQIQRKLDVAEGMAGNVFVMDLQTGEEISINGDVALSGLSILKIAIFVEAYRTLDGPPDEYVQGLFYDTAVQSSNYGANLLLHVIAGQNNTYEGAAVLTESMRRLGLVNTFMAIPYDAIPVSTRPNTYSTPANTNPDLLLVPDSAMQTTAEEIGTLLSMIYYCAQGGGALLAVYPGEITPQECQAILDLMVLNDEGNLIRFGVPADVTVSHKHGWDFVTHGDAGIVFSPGGDFVIVEYLSTINSDWLANEISFPILRQIAQLTYNYFNFDDPYVEDVLVRAEREAAARAAAAEAEATEAAIEAESTAEPTEEP